MGVRGQDKPCMSEKEGWCGELRIRMAVVGSEGIIQQKLMNQDYSLTFSP